MEPHIGVAGRGAYCEQGIKYKTVDTENGATQTAEYDTHGDY